MPLVSVQGSLIYEAKIQGMTKDGATSLYHIHYKVRDVRLVPGVTDLPAGLE